MLVSVGRGYMRSGQGNPDEARSARYVLKDYVKGKLLFCHPPPEISDQDFNRKNHELALLHAAGKKRAPVTRVGKGADTFVPSNATVTLPDGKLSAKGQGHKSQAVDRDFFANNSTLSSRPFIQGSGLRNGQEFSRATLFPHQKSIADDGTPLVGRQSGIAAGLVIDVDKKRHKKMKRVKQRSGKGYD
jgi:large subunit GTPase 1